MTEIFWAVGRGGGVTLLVLLTLCTAAGLLTGGGRKLPGLERFSLTLVHRNLALLSTLFLGVHLASLLLDDYAKLTILDLIVPFRSAAANPVFVGLGAVALDLLIAIVGTALLRNRIGPGLFKGVHWLAYLLWPVAVIHGLGTGSDAGSGWFLAVTGCCAAIVAGALLMRLAPVQARAGHDDVSELERNNHDHHLV